MSNTVTLYVLFPSPVLADLLSLFLLHSDEAFYQRNITERTGHALFQVQRALKRIEDSGLIRKKKDGNRVYYESIPYHPAFEGLKLAFIRTIAIGDVVKEALTPFQDQIQFAFIYGSIAEGKETADSDLDIFLLGTISLKELATEGIIDILSKKLKREVNPVIYSSGSFKKKLVQGNRFIQELISCTKIWLIGNQDDFTGMVG